MTTRKFEHCEDEIGRISRPVVSDVSPSSELEWRELNSNEGLASERDFHTEIACSNVLVILIYTPVTYLP